MDQGLPSSFALEVKGEKTGGGLVEEMLLIQKTLKEREEPKATPGFFKRLASLPRFKTVSTAYLADLNGRQTLIVSPRVLDSLATVAKPHSSQFWLGGLYVVADNDVVDRKATTFKERMRYLFTGRFEPTKKEV